MPQIAIVCTSKSVDLGHLALLVDAWDKQEQEFVAKWNAALPPEQQLVYRPVVLYTTPADLPTDTGEFWLLVIEDDIKAPGAEGFHDDRLGVIFARCLPENNCEAVPHEILEMVLDSTCDQYRPLGDGSGRQIALEDCDPVEGDSYTQQAQIGDQPPQDVKVTNWVYPSYFDPNGVHPFDRNGKLTAPFTMDDGGYQIIMSADGSTSEVFARTEKGHMAAEKKRQRPDSRLSRRLALKPRYRSEASSPMMPWGAGPRPEGYVDDLRRSEVKKPEEPPANPGHTPSFG